MKIKYKIHIKYSLDRQVLVSDLGEGRSVDDVTGNLKFQGLGSIYRPRTLKCTLLPQAMTD